MTEDDDEKVPEFWWQNEDGAAIVRTIWAAVEASFALGVDTTVKLSKPGQPILTIGFDHDVTDEDLDGEGF